MIGGTSDDEMIELSEDWAIGREGHDSRCNRYLFHKPCGERSRIAPQGRKPCCPNSPLPDSLQKKVKFILDPR